MEGGFNKYCKWHLLADPQQQQQKQQSVQCLKKMPVWGTEQFVVLGPTEPIVALLGTDIILPCLLSPLMSAEHMEVRWFRSQFSEAVFVFQKGKEETDEQLVEYTGRTELISEFITEGRLAVKIYNVQISDNGKYQCYFRKGDVYEQASLEVKVAGLGSAPHLRLEGHEDGGVKLACMTDGWFPQPQVQWRDNRGGKLSSLSETQAQDEAGFFHVKALIVVQESSVRNVSCSICNKLLSQEKISAIDIPGQFSVLKRMIRVGVDGTGENHSGRKRAYFWYVSLLIPLGFSIESFFPKTSPWKKALSGILPVVGILLGISIFFILKERKKTKKLLQEKKEDKKDKDNLRTELEKRKHLYDSAWRKAHIYADWRKQHFDALNVTLDPASAHPGLVLSENGKFMRVENEVKSAEETFSVLGREPITSGRCYWEVKVAMEAQNKATWQLGICRESAKRSGWVRESPGMGFWAVGCSDGTFQPIVSKQSVAPSLGKPPEQIGIFLDYEAGKVSFYNMTDGSHIYNFPPASFSGPVRPYFSIQTLNTSFTICGVSDRPESIPAPSLETPGTAQEQEKFLGDKNKALEEESTPTQSHSPPIISLSPSIPSN
ncbi:LOW QUALITY PROTEIN: butyrophilin subfamily 1 member A1-like [Monodelphis domestica]|uniref:LOW QUALITY PROTEIN: butyrophilin subfamily 1 member A1-like n=1 Tax=Monodelphis domestica TaxID=13616 RepID=UPI0024E25395|nr:LOW QUALITY PROTEIN: butyrophilin subfamily 1 member A1-like [Monodelphis domestica]